MEWNNPDSEYEDEIDIDIDRVEDLTKIQDLSLDDAYDLGRKLEILGGQKISGPKDVQLVLKIHFLKSIGGMEAKGREPFQILKNIQNQHRLKCKGLVGLFKSMKEKLGAEVWKDLVADLTETVIGFKMPDSFDEHISRLSNEECCRIMVTGELCSGKTTLINSLLGVRILPSSALSNTITMCEIRYGETLWARATPWTSVGTCLVLATVLLMEEDREVNEFEEILTLEVTSEEDCDQVVKLKFEVKNPNFDEATGEKDPEAESRCRDHNSTLGDFGQKTNSAINLWHSRAPRSEKRPVAVKIIAKGELFVRALGHFVQAKKAEDDDVGLYKILEVFLPNPLLEGGLTIVDSPGIGDNEPLNRMVIEYTAEAFAFIYVVNCAMKGGVQEDRLKMLLNKVHARKMLNQQSMFAPASAIFVCNKWDEVKLANHERVMKYIMRGLEDCWPGVTIEQTVPFCASEAIRVYEQGLLTPEFKDLLQKFEQLIPHGLENKLYHSCSWLEGILLKIDEFLLRCLGNLNVKEDEIRERFNDAKLRMQKLQELSEENFKDLTEFVNKQVDEAVLQLSEYLQSEEIIEQIATWKDSEVPAATMQDWQNQKILICKQLEIKVKDYVNKWAKETKFLEQVNPMINERFMKWFGQRKIADELGKIRDVVINREALDLMSVKVSGFTERKESLLLDIIQETATGMFQKHKVACIIALPVAVPVALVAALPLVVAIGFDTLLRLGKRHFHMSRLDDYRDDRHGVLSAFTKEIVPHYCVSKKFREYLTELLKDSFALVDELRTVIPKQLEQERKIMVKIEEDHRDGVHLQRQYEPFLEICRLFRRYIQQYAVMNLCINDREVKVIPFSDIAVERNLQPITKGWFSEVVEVKVTADGHWMRRQLAVLEAGDVEDYLLEERFWRTQTSPHLPTLVSISINENRVHQILTNVGRLSLRAYLASLEGNNSPIATRTKQGTDDLKEKVGRLQPLALQIVDGLAYLHDRRFVCGDLSLDTITVTDNGTLKLTNVSTVKRLSFSLSKILQQAFPENLNRVRYLPGELLAERRYFDESGLRTVSKAPAEKDVGDDPMVYEEKCDIYSYALALWEMTTSELAFQKQIVSESVSSLEDFFKKIIFGDNKLPEIPDLNICPDSIVEWFNIIELCWQSPPFNRPVIRVVKTKLEKSLMNDPIEFTVDHFGTEGDEG